MQVNPCLFIGIGSTGKDILTEVRRLCYEEFGKGGLPCFRYVVIETDAAAQKPQDDDFLDANAPEYERNKFIPITIDDVSALKHKLTPGAPNEIKGVMDWLDPRVLELGAVSWMAGAGANRQIGRLCFYNHWSRVDSAISASWNDLHRTEASRETDEFLRKVYFPTKKMSREIPVGNLVSDRVRVFICGTLCGGTCSGTFLDVAYTVRRLLNNPAQEIIGLFALPPITNARTPAEKGRVANAWAALKELDYYTQPGTRFRVRLPDGGDIDSDDEPFNHTYFVTLANRDQRQFRIGEQGVEDLTGMCALSLFAETVPEISSVKDAIRADLRSMPGYAGLNSAGRVQSFSSFGLSAIWYPRYRITRAISFALGSDMARYFIGSCNAPALVDERVQSEWADFLSWAKGSLIGTVNGAHCIKNLPLEIESAFSEYQPLFLSTVENELADFVSNFPSREKHYRDLLANPSGDYYRLIALSETAVRRELKERLVAHLDALLQEYSLEEAKRYCDTLINTMRAEAESIPLELPQLGELINTSDAKDFTKDWPTRLVFLGSRAEEEYKKYLWTEFKNRILENVNNIRDHFLRPILEQVIKDLRVKQDEILALVNRLQSLDRDCQQARRREEEPRPSVNIFTVSQGEPRSIGDDVDLALGTIRTTKSPASLKHEFLARCSVDSILRGRPEALLNQVENCFRDAGHEEASKFTISGNAINDLRPSLNLVVQTAAPYFEAIPTYVPLAVNRPCNRLFGKYDTGLAELVDIVSGHLSVGERKFSAESTHLDHFVICYRETAGIAISDLKICVPGEDNLTERERSMSCTSYSHKLGARAFDTLSNAQTNRALELIKTALSLAPGAFPAEGSSHYALWRNDGIDQALCLSDDEKVRIFVETEGLVSLEALIYDALRKLGHEAFNDLINQRLSALNIGRNRELLQSKYLELRRSVFPSVPRRS